jgi:hypothetical protein
LFYAASTRPFLRSASTRTARVSTIFIRRGASQLCMTVLGDLGQPPRAALLSQAAWVH